MLHWKRFFSPALHAQVARFETVNGIPLPPRYTSLMQRSMFPFLAMVVSIGFNPPAAKCADKPSGGKPATAVISAPERWLSAKTCVLSPLAVRVDGRRAVVATASETMLYELESTKNYSKAVESRIAVPARGCRLDRLHAHDVNQFDVDGALIQDLFRSTGQPKHQGTTPQEEQFRVHHVVLGTIGKVDTKRPERSCLQFLPKVFWWHRVSPTQILLLKL